MERPEIEPGAVAGLELGPQPLDLELADHVGQRLARPADVAVGLDDRVGLGQAGRLQEVDRALARPAERVDPGVDDEPAGPPGLRVEHPEPLALVPVEAHLVGQPLAVQAPALDVGPADDAGAEPSERVEVRVLGLERDLEVVAGRRLVVGRRGELRVLAAREVVAVGVVDAVARAVRLGRVVVGERRVLLLVLLDRADLAVRPRQDTEVLRGDRHRPLDVLGGPSDELVLGARDVGRVVAEGLRDRPRCRRRSRRPGRSRGAPPRWSRAGPCRSRGPRSGPGPATSSCGWPCGTGPRRSGRTRCPGPRGSRRDSRP